jgi:hypothetical protein
MSWSRPSRSLPCVDLHGIRILKVSSIVLFPGFTYSINLSSMEVLVPAFPVILWYTITFTMVCIVKTQFNVHHHCHHRKPESKN